MTVNRVHAGPLLEPLNGVSGVAMDVHQVSARSEPFDYVGLTETPIERHVSNDADSEVEMAVECAVEQRRSQWSLIDVIGAQRPQRALTKPVLRHDGQAHDVSQASSEGRLARPWRTAHDHDERTAASPATTELDLISCVRRFHREDGNGTRSELPIAGVAAPVRLGSEPRIVPARAGGRHFGSAPIARTDRRGAGGSEAYLSARTRAATRH